jgi:NAD(P)-dependent dehydrogenase (short-subunit alcohol dehydrogenase family)
MSTIIITGSTRGIGHGLAIEFLERGHQVVINGRNKEKVAEMVMVLGKNGGEVCGLAGSAAESETHQLLIDLAVKSYGKVDYYINNAGIPNPHKSFVDLDKEDVKSLINTNVYGLMIGTSIAANHMVKQGSGKIFNMEGFGSDGRMREKLTLYGTSKRAVNYFTKSISNEVKNSDIQIGVISPGMVRTDLINQSMEFGTEKEKKQFDKVYRILAEDVDVVTKFLVEGMLKSKKNYDRISFLSGTKLMFKIIRLMFS